MAFERDVVIAKLQELGMTGAGAIQVVDAVALVDPADRRLLAQIVGNALGAPATGPLTPGADGQMLASSTEPGTSKVSTRIVGENFD